jgi:tRNA threonylcarbamoyl adenosine modification protein YjeE
MAASETPSIIDLPDEAATEALAADLAAALARGDVVALSGGLGAGKTTFARALIRAFLADPALEVPSPTFTLVQTYAGGRFPLAHFDFYRLSSADEIDEIGLDDALAGGAALVEWPERAPSRLPAERLDLAFEILGGARRLAISGDGSLPARFRRSRAIRTFLDRAGWKGAERRFLQGDASTRAYERVRAGERRGVLMDWPPANAGLPGGKRSAYRATDVRPFIAVDNALRAAGLSAPELYAADMGAGFLLMEDFGAEGVVAGAAPIAERYHVAMAVLAEIHNRPRPAELPLPEGTVHRLPAYRSEMLADELELFLDWYFPHVIGAPAAPADRAAFQAAWAPLLARLDRAERSWVLLDVHSPNLLWLRERDGLRRIGLLDFQDAMIGPTAYDVASLAQDARVTVPADLERALVGRYVALRRQADADFDAQIFGAAYAILAAQRAMRILGVFVRLAEKAGKPHYLNHIPRVREYLRRTLAEPVLSGVSVWYEKHRFP